MKSTSGWEKHKMSTIDQVRQLRMSGKTDGEIIADLQEQGLNPREINDVLSRSKVKDAVFNGQQQTEEFSEDFGAGMQSSIMNPNSQVQQNQYQEQYSGYENQNSQGSYKKQTQEMPGEASSTDSGQTIPEAYSNYQGYENQGQGYQNQGQEYQQYNAVNTETMTEIASQLMDEKIMKITGALKDLTDMKSILDVQVRKIDERLTRIESIIDSLQTSLIRKTSEQEQNISDIKTELHGMQTGFSKIINPMVDRSREHHVHHKTYAKTTHKKKAKKK